MNTRSQNPTGLTEKRAQRPLSTSQATLGAGSDTERGALGGERGRGTGGTNGHCHQRYTQAQAKQGRRLDPGQEHGSVGSSTPTMGLRRHTAMESVPYKAPVMLQGQERNGQVRATSQGGSCNLGGTGTQERQPGLGIRRRAHPQEDFALGHPDSPTLDSWEVPKRQKTKLKRKRASVLCFEAIHSTVTEWP